MAVRFSERERDKIVQALLSSAQAHAAHDGLKKTTVDELAAEAGISKGAFYSFYPTKEHLFLDMLEHWHKDVAEKAAAAMRLNAALPDRQRAAETLKATVRAMRESPLARFQQRDVPLLMRKIPESLWREHYQSDEAFVRGLIADMGVQLTAPEEVVFSAVRILFLSQLTAEQAGPGYERAVDALIDGAVLLLLQEK